MRVLFLTHRLPYAPNRGDRIRAFHIVEQLKPHVDLEVASLAHSREELAMVGQMRSAGVNVSACLVPRAATLVKAAFTLAGSRPLTHALLDAPGFKRLLGEIVARRRPDVVLAFCSGMARFALERPLDAIPSVVDLVDVDSAKWLELSGRATWPKRWIFGREARCLAAFERTLTARARATVVVNGREADILRALAPGGNVQVIPNGIALESFRPSTEPQGPPRLVFCGVMNYAANVEGVLWFAREVWPAIRAAQHDATFTVVGSDPTPAIRDLAAPGSGIEVTGTVPSVQDYLWRSAVSVAPLHLARGIQNKVLEALAAGLPTVVTPAVAEGLPPAAMPGCRVAGDSAQFAREVVSVLALAPAARREMAARADLTALGWQHQLHPLKEMLRQAAVP